MRLVEFDPWGKKRKYELRTYVIWSWRKRCCFFNQLIIIFLFMRSKCFQLKYKHAQFSRFARSMYVYCIYVYIYIYMACKMKELWKICVLFVDIVFIQTLMIWVSPRERERHGSQGQQHQSQPANFQLIKILSIKTFLLTSQKHRPRLTIYTHIWE